MKYKDVSQVNSVADWIGWLYHHSMKSTGHSWTRLNGALAGALLHSISAGIPFAPDDFKKIYDSYRGGFWFGESGGGERFYCAAAKVNNVGACASFESWKGREPFLYEGMRMAIGSEFQWNGKEYRVNSFDDKSQSLNAGCYQNERGHRVDEIQSRLKINVADFKAMESEKRKAKKAAKAAVKKSEEVAA